MLKAHEKLFALFQKLIDILIVLICWVFAYYLRFYQLPGAQYGIEMVMLFAKLTFVLIAITQYSFHKNGLYRSQRFNSRYNEILAVFRANTIATLGLILTIYFFAEDRLSRIALGTYYFTSSFSLILVRIMVRNFLRSLRRKGKNLRFILLVGQGPQLLRYVETLRNFKDAGVRIGGWIDPPQHEEVSQIKKIHLPLHEAIAELSPDGIVIGYSGRDSDKVEEILKRNYDSLTPIQVLPDLSYSFIGHEIEEFAGIPLLSVNKPRLSSFDQFVKRAIDFCAALFGIFLISPLLFIISVVIKLSSRGPIFYGQERIGLDGRPFTMWKFRTMKMAEQGEDKTSWSSKDDPRKTRFGSFLRKTSLDELPQLWNVLIGQMSLIGPRPERPFFVEKFKKEIPLYMLRHKMKSGITGWAQVNGWRGDTSLSKRIECDIYYIKNWSLWLDCKILFLTFWKGFFNKNAY